MLGILGEYVILILTHSRNLPLVIEEDRINFLNFMKIAVTGGSGFIGRNFINYIQKKKMLIL